MIMFAAENNIGLSEYAVRCALLELKCEEQQVSMRQVAAHIKCSESTVKRAMSRLMAADLLERLDGSRRGGGYRYAVKY